MKSLGNLLQYLKPYRRAALLAPLFMVLEVCMDLIQPMLMQKAIDVGIAEKNPIYVIKIGFLMIGIAIVGSIGGVLCTIFSSKAAMNMGADLREKLFKTVQFLSMRELNELTTGQLVTILTNDVTRIQNMTVMILRILIRIPLLLFGSLVMAIITSPKLSLIFVVLVPLLVLSVLLIMKKGFLLFREVQPKLDRINGVIQENLSGIRVVKAFVRSNLENKRFEKANGQLMKKTMDASRHVAMALPIMVLFLHIGLVGVIWFGGLEVYAGNLKIGKIIAFINYLAHILGSMMMLAMLLIHVSRAEASAVRIQEVLDLERQIEKNEEGSKAVIHGGKVEFDHVSFSYDATLHEPVLRDISFTANPGDTVALLGTTGSGKSTLLHLIPRFYNATEGKITIDGNDIKDMNIKSLREQIAIVLQQSILFSGTIKENILFGKPDATEEEMIKAAKMAQAHEFIVKLPDGYETKLGQRGINLSGGQRQRIAIARALIMKPKILILDDSTSSVDVNTESRIQDSLKELMKNHTSFIVAQRISTVMDADKIIVLDRGRIEAMGTHKELMKNSKIYRDIYESQLGGEDIA